MITLNASKSIAYQWSGFVCLSVGTLDKVGIYETGCEQVMNTIKLKHKQFIVCT
jgi:hypothetical protein